VDGEIDLFEIVQARRPPRARLRGGQNRQEQRGENGNDGNHHQQFGQGEGGSFHLAASLIFYAHNISNANTG